MIVGRLHEKRVLEKLYDSRSSEFLAVYGRRRVGKTFLISQFFKDRGLYFEITGSKGSATKEQIGNFHREFVALFKPEGKYPIPKNWSEALHNLLESLKKIDVEQKIILFFDELPWLATQKSGFLSALDYFWNRHFSRMPNVLLIICGSAASWMIKKVVNDKGGLHGRLSAEMRLSPFSIGEVAEYLQSNQIDLPKKQIVELYMATGGVPKYLRHVERGKSSAQIINALCFMPQSPLLKEFHNLYSSLFEDSHRHIKIVKELAKKRRGMTQKEIFESLNLSAGGNSAALLEELELCGFIIGMQAYGKEVKNMKFRLVDEYSLFYLMWIDENKQTLLQGGDKNYWGKIQMSQTWHSWAGYAFENICMKHSYKIKEFLEIGGVTTRESHWQYIPRRESDEEGAEIDLVIDRADQCINLCEIKFYNSTYALTAADAATIERKKAVFREKTRTKKAIFTTLITPYGVKENEHYLRCIDNQMTLDALF